MNLKIDPRRILREGAFDPSDPSVLPIGNETRIFVRAQDIDGSWRSVDIACLDRESLLVWLRSTEGGNPWTRTENVVLLILNHQPQEGGHVS